MRSRNNSEITLFFHSWERTHEQYDDESVFFGCLRTNIETTINDQNQIIPEEVMDAIRCGRLTAPRKLDGGVRGIVVGDVFRRAVARTIAKQIVDKVEEAISPHQYALKTKAGCETVAHILQVLSDADPDATVVSVDGIGAFDLISRNAMMQCVRRMDEGEQILPFIRAFCGQPSTYLWEDDVGEVHIIPQGERGEQGDPLMPLLFCLSQHPALAAVSAGLRDCERLFAFHDDLYIVCRPERVGAVHDLLRRYLWQHAGMSLHAVKTKVWNRSGACPPACVAMQRAAVAVSPTAVVWRGDHELPTHQQGLKVLGVPLGHPDFVLKFLEAKIAKHRVLLERIPLVPDTQSAWLLLSFCAAAPSEFLFACSQP